MAFTVADLPIGCTDEYQLTYQPFWAGSDSNSSAPIAGWAWLCGLPELKLYSVSIGLKSTDWIIISTDQIPQIEKDGSFFYML